MADNTIQLKIALDSVQAQAAIEQLNRNAAFSRLNESVRQLGATLDRSVGELQRQSAAIASVKTSVGGLSGALATLRTSIPTLGGLIGGSLAGLLGPLAGGAAATGFVRLADEAANLDARLKLVTTSTAEFARAQTGLFAIAQSTSSSFAGTVDLYSRFATATRDLGLTQERLLAITTTVNQAVQLSGTSSQGAEAALVQLGQGLASGALRGEELNSVLEQTPRLAQAIAAGLGVTVGQLRTLAKDNQLTSSAIVNALESQRQTLEREFSTLPQTVGRALTQLGNTALQASGQINQSTGITQSLASAIGDLSTALQSGALRDGIDGAASAISLLSRNLDVVLAFFIGRAALPVALTAATAAFSTLTGSVALLGPALGTVAAASLGLQAALAPLLGTVGVVTLSLAALGVGIVAIRESESSLERVTNDLTEAKKKLAEASDDNARAATHEAFAKRQVALAELEQLKNAARQSPFVAGVGQAGDRRRLESEIDALDYLITERQRQAASDFLPPTVSAAQGAPVDQKALNSLQQKAIELRSRLLNLSNLQQVQESILNGELRTRSALEQQAAVDVAKLEDAIVAKAKKEKEEADARRAEDDRRLEALRAQIEAESELQATLVSVQTPAEQFSRLLADINRQVADGTLDEVARRLGTTREDVQNRLLIAAGNRLPSPVSDEVIAETQQRFDVLTTFAEEAGRNIQDALAGALRNGFDGGLKGALRSLAGFLADAASQLAASGILNALFGSQGGAAGLLGSGGFGSVVGSLFSGLGFANGGNPPVGRASLVGERGPELFIPRVPGTIVPNNRLGDFGRLGASLPGGGGVNIGDINIDARGAQDPQGIIRAGAALKADILQSVGKAMQRGYSPGSN